MLTVQSSTALYVHLFVFFLLVTGFNPAWFGHYGLLEGEEDCPPCILEASALAGAGKEDYRAGPKMVHVTCRHVMPSVGSMES